MILYDWSPAPNPRRVRFFAAEKAIELRTVPVNLTKREQLEAPFEQINSRRTIPVLELDNGERLSETIAICSYLESTYPTPVLMGRSSLQRAEVLMWDRICETDGFGSIAESYRNCSPFFENRSLPGETDYPQIPALVERGRQRTHSFLQMLDERLKDVAYLTGDQFSLADITAYVMLDFAQWIKVFVTKDHRHVYHWFHKISERPGARA